MPNAICSGLNVYIEFIIDASDVWICHIFCRQFDLNYVGAQLGSDVGGIRNNIDCRLIVLCLTARPEDRTTQQPPSQQDVP